MSPKIAVVLAWDGRNPDFLIAAMHSVCLQTFPPTEVHLVLDHPSAPAPRFQTDVRIIQHRTSGVGPALARNKALDSIASDIDFVAMMDADDISHPTRFETQVEEITRRAVDAIGSQAVILDHNRIYLHPRRPTADAEVAKQLSSGRMPFVHPTMMFKAEVIRAGFRYPDTKMRGEDLLLVRKINNAGFRLANSDAYLLAYRHKLLRNYSTYRADVEIQDNFNLALLPARYISHLVFRLTQALGRPHLRRQWKQLLFRYVTLKSQV